MEYVANHPDVEVLGAVAVASNQRRGERVPVDILLDREGNQVVHGVDKNGLEVKGEPPVIWGDTVEALNRISVPIIVGIGDVGKMDRFDDVKRGAPVTRKAVELILTFSEKTANRGSFPASCRGGDSIADLLKKTDISINYHRSPGILIRMKSGCPWRKIARRS